MYQDHLQSRPIRQLKALSHHLTFHPYHRTLSRTISETRRNLQRYGAQVCHQSFCPFRRTLTSPHWKSLSRGLGRHPRRESAALARVGWADWQAFDFPLSKSWIVLDQAVLVVPSFVRYGWIFWNCSARAYPESYSTNLGNLVTMMLWRCFYRDLVPLFRLNPASLSSC